MATKTKTRSYGSERQFVGSDIDEMVVAFNQIINDPDNPDNEFDFPDYGGLPESVNSKLTGDEVDAIQSELQGVTGPVSFRIVTSWLRSYCY